MKRYSFLDEKTAVDLIATLKINFGQTTSDSISGIMVWGFEDKYQYDAETKESVLIEKGLTFNVDVCWKDTPPIAWDKYEVFPKTPSHS
jgi:hypothetical protein